jgi:hypothetical protein
MTPLEAVAKAIAKEDWGHGRAGGPWSDEVWDRLLKGYYELLASDEPVFIHETHYLHSIFRKARAAVRTLATGELSEQMEQATTALDHTPIKLCKSEGEKVFRAMLDAVIHPELY